MDVLLLIGAISRSRTDETMRCVINNYQQHFGDPAKLATYIIEHDVDTAAPSEADETIKVYTFAQGSLVLLGEFYSSWEFEEWLYSDLPFEEWRKNRS